jgi:hypothetical protein
MSDPLGKAESLWQLRKRLKHTMRRRLRYVHNWLSKATGVRPAASARAVPHAGDRLQAGDLVHVRSKCEIRATLDRWNRLKGCDFMEEMWSYCGTIQRVLKRVDRFLSEQDYRIRRCRGIVLLDGVACQGTKAYGVCHRSCLFFWREEWLEKVNRIFLPGPEV